jgi:hypothetical protein
VADDVRLVVHGVDELGDAFDALLRELRAEAQAGFVPEAQYRGQAGKPFTLDSIDLITRANDLGLD